MYEFKIEQVDIFNMIGYAKAICVTTNGIVKSNGQLVMGAGVAKQFANRFIQLPYILGNKVSKYGNHVFECGEVDGTHLLSFPTKHNYSDKSDIELIAQSATRLVKWANLNNITEQRSIFIPSPGTGLGGLSKDKVYSVLNTILDERFVICTK